ncbi:protein lethal(2)essential for life-like [Periplaneta americana]|uniref:protein lethal(2)essential for life-like n=1 Tax=Periplaneta americana TaxID=6978 RepID=UPI0037E72299
MSLLPFILDDLVNECRRPCHLFDQNFGLGMLGDDLLHPRHSLVGPLRAGYYRPWRYSPTQKSGMCKIKDDKDTFKVNLDVQQFSPDEITVKTVDDYVVVEGKHEEREDEHGYISRHFTRRYKLPADCKSDDVISSLSSDGVLTITAPKKVLPLPAANERVVPITKTNAPAVKEVSGKDEKMEQ